MAMKIFFPKKATIGAILSVSVFASDISRDRVECLAVNSIESNATRQRQPLKVEIELDHVVLTERVHFGFDLVGFVVEQLLSSGA